MKKTNFLLLMLLSSFLMFLTTNTQAQLIVNTSYTATEMVNDFFNAEGNCVTVSNVTFTGVAEQKAFFDASSIDLDINNGILLATGDVAIVAQTNNANGAGGAVGSNDDGDVDLENIIGYDTNDAAVLEFDIVPETDTMVFTYIFGSEEYLEFVNSSFNDVFAFFISGPGIDSLQNIAMIPGTTTPVAINNVNNMEASEYYVNNPSGGDIQYDGYTTPLDAVVILTPFETYHVKIAVADASDSILDSGVFIGIQSLCGEDTLGVKVEFDWEAVDENSNTVNFQTNTNYSNCEVLWDFGDGTQSTEQNPTHTYSGAGTYAVSLTANKYGVSDSFMRPIIVTGDAVGIEENKNLSFNISPNPAHDFITLSLNNQNQNRTSQVRLLDVQGQVQYQQNLASGVSNTIDISGLEKGIYLIQVQTGEEMVTKKWMKF